MNSFIVDKVTELRISIYLVGYPDRGESIVFIFTDETNTKIYYSAVIDCYNHNGQNKTEEILLKYNIKSLDMLCWSHTDEDHSLGLSNIINNHCSKETIFVLPEGIHGHEDDYVTYNDEIKNCFSLINKTNNNINYNVYTASANTEGHNVLQKWEIIDNLKRKLDCAIIAISPNSSLLRRRVGGEIKKKNELSIALIFKVGELSFLFSSDIENQTLQLIAKEHIANLSMIKTPHHTSKSSDKLLDIFEEVNDIGYKIPLACSTSYKVHKLPDLALVDSYRKYSDSFYYTGLDEQKDTFGVVKLSFELNTNSYQVELSGNASRLF